MPFVIECSDIPDILSDEVRKYYFLADGYPAGTSGRRRWLKGRLTVDTVEIKLAEYSYDEDNDQSGGQLTATLANLSQYSLFTRTASLKFELGEKISGTWQWTTKFDSGRLQASGRELANSGDSPNDKITIVAQPLLQQRLETSPLNTFVLYDPAKLAVLEADFVAIAGIDGVVHPVTIVAVPDLSVWKIMDFVAEACGFSPAGSPAHFFKSNIPDDPIRRADFPPATPYWNTLADIIGPFKAEIDVDADDNLVIRDGTNDLLPDSSAAVAIGVDRLITSSDSREIQRFRGVFLTYQEQGLGWDYWTLTIIQTNDASIPLLNRYRETWLRRYYRTSFPDTPVKELRTLERKWVQGPGGMYAASLTAIQYNNVNLESGRQVNKYTTNKIPQSWATFALTHGFTVANFPALNDGDIASGFVSASDTVFTNTFALNAINDQVYVYLAHPFVPDSVYMAAQTSTSFGLITRDSDNKQLDEDYDQPLLTAQRAGNLASGQGSYWGQTGHQWETQTVTRDRKVIIQSSEGDSLNNPEELLLADFEDIRVGDIAIPIHQTIQHQTYVDDEGDEAALKWLPLNGGEFTIATLKALSIRYNRAQFYPGKGQFPFAGFDLGMVRGRAINPTDRDGASAGTYRITGFTISQAAGGRTQTVLRGKQIGSPDVIAADSAQINDVIGVAEESGQVRTVTIRVLCQTGWVLAGQAVADFTVEARHGHSGLFVDIEAATIDLATWNGSIEDFEVRITGGTFTTHIVRSFILTAGPPTLTGDMFYGADAMTYLGDQMTYTS